MAPPHGPGGGAGLIVALATDRSPADQRHIGALASRTVDRVVVVDHCRRRDWLPVLVSLAWTVVTEHLAQRFGFALSGGPVLGVVDGAFTGGVGRYWDEHDERDAALAVAAAHGSRPRGASPSATAAPICRCSPPSAARSP